MRQILVRIFVLFASLALPPGMLWAQNYAACAPEPEVEKALNALPALIDPELPWAERLSAIQALLKKYPRDLFVHQRYANFLRSKMAMEEFDRAMEMYRSRPSDPLYRFGEALLTASFHPKKSVAMLEELLAANPDFVLTRFHLVQSQAGFLPGDRKAADTHARRLIEKCPSNPDFYTVLAQIDDTALLREAAPRLRRLLEERSSVSPGLWRALWSIEFKAASAEERPALKERLLADVKKLEAGYDAPSREFASAFQTAADLAADESIRQRYEDSTLARFPKSAQAVEIEQTRWRKANPQPPRNAAPEAMRAYVEKSAAFEKQLFERFPESFSLLWNAYSRTRFPQPQPMPLEERLAITDRFQRRLEASPDLMTSSPPGAILLAEQYADWKTRLDQVPALLATGLREAERRAKYEMDASMLPEAARAQAPPPGDQLRFARQRAEQVFADLALALGKAAEARIHAERGLAIVEERWNRPLSDRQKSQVDFERRAFVLRQARASAMEKDYTRALTYFKEYLQGTPRALLTSPPAPNSAVPEARQAFLAAGGKDEEWLAWATAGRPDEKEGSSVKLTFGRTLPDFEAKDLTGRTWRLADFKGKVTLVDLWATWCGPCRGEHPEVERFYQLIKSRSDIQLLTISMDDVPALAENYVKKSGYTFPAIVSKALAERLFPTYGLPSAYVVDAQGRLSELTRFQSAERALKQLEELAKEK